MNKSIEGEMKEWNKAVEQHYLKQGGFCGYCGEACKPFHHNLPREFRDTACEYNGEHPDCGRHSMVFREITPETFGGYEIYECTKCGWQEAL